MIRQLLVIAGLLLGMGLLYLVVRRGAGHWNRFWAEQADRLDTSSTDEAREPQPGGLTDSTPRDSREG